MSTTPPPTREEALSRTAAGERQERLDQARLIMRTAAGLVGEKVASAGRQFQRAVEERRAAEDEQSRR